MILNATMIILALVVAWKILMLVKDAWPKIKAKLPSKSETKRPSLLHGLVDQLHDLSVKATDDNTKILAELNSTFDRLLGMQLSTPEGRAKIEEKLAIAKKVAEVAVPLAVKAAVALI